MDILCCYYCTDGVGLMEFAGVDKRQRQKWGCGKCRSGHIGTIWQGWTMQEEKRVQVSSTETVLYYKPRLHRLCTPTQNRDYETNSNKQVLKVTVKLLHIITYTYYTRTQ